MEIKFLTVEDVVEQGIVTCTNKGTHFVKDPKTGRTVAHQKPMVDKEELATILQNDLKVVCVAELEINVAGHDGKMYLFISNQSGRARVSCINAMNLNNGTTHKLSGIWWRSFNLGTRTDRVNATLAFSHLLLPNEVVEACYQHAANEFGLKGGVSEEAMSADIDG